jgi:superfamily II DNA or RNA helicase
MKIIIESPTYAYLHNTTAEEVETLKKQFAFKNGKIEEQIKRTRRKGYWKRRDPEGFQQHIDALKAQVDDNVLKTDGALYYLKPGSISYIEGINFDIENKITYPELKPLNWKVEPEFTPYQYQYDSVRNLLRIGHGNVCLPTGCGKSFILLMLSRLIGESVVVVTPSKAIFRELLAEFQLRLGKDKVGGYGDGLKDIKKPITIVIGKSITMLKEGTPQYEFFKSKQALLVDESHTWGADTLESVCHGVLKDAPRRFFMSATQTRGDGTVKLLQSIIGETVLEMSLLEAIQSKYLCPLRFYIKKTFSPSVLKKKDPLECKRTHFLYNQEVAKFYGQIANAMWKVNQESTLILVEELVQIKMLVDLLDVPFAYVHGGSKKEAAKWGLEKVNLTTEIERFNNGEIKVLIGTKAIATGTNMYPTHNTCNWVGGASEIITKQGAMGRSTRWMKKKYAKFHKPKTHTKVWDVDVTGQQILTNMLKKRVKYYSEALDEDQHIKLVS